MNYVAIGCITIDNILNAYGEKRLRQFGGNAAYGAMGMRLWQPGQIGMGCPGRDGLPRGMAAGAYRDRY